MTFRDLWDACYETEYPDNERHAESLIKKHLTYLRMRLREWLGLPDDWNPIPIATSRQWSDCTLYTLSLCR